MREIDKLDKFRLMDDVLWIEVFDKYNLYLLDISSQETFMSPRLRLDVLNRLFNGTYEWKPVRQKFVPKDDGTLREVLVLDDYDKFLMSAITELYSERYEQLISPYCMSYRKGYSIAKVTREIWSKKCFKGYKVDLKKYFDSVPLERIIDTLNLLDKDSPITKSLIKFYQDERVYIGEELIQRFKSICQGCSFSGFLSNLILKDLDNELAQICTVYYRYSDDMILLGEKADEALELLMKRLREYGLTINEKKLSIIDGEFTFLGVKISEDSLRWSNRKRETIKKRIRNYAKKCKPGNRNSQSKLIRNIQKYLFEENDGYSYFGQLCQLNTDGSDIRWLSEYCKSEIRAAYIGSHNFTRGKNRTSDETLKELGWVNLDFLYNLYNQSTILYRARTRFILEPHVKKDYIDTITRDEITPYLSELSGNDVNMRKGLVKLQGSWYKIKREEKSDFEEVLLRLWRSVELYYGYTPLNNLQSKTYYDTAEIMVVAIKLLIASSKIEFDGLYKRYGNLVLWKEWFE